MTIEDLTPAEREEVQLWWLRQYEARKRRAAYCGPMDIKRRRERIGWSQAQLGKALGVDQKTVSRWESGHVTVSAAARTRCLAVFEGRA